jgi:hypothetical protein
MRVGQGAALAWVLFTLACEPSVEIGPPELASRFDTVAGIVHVVNSGTPPEWRLEEIARIGSLDAGPAAFGNVRSVVLDASGSIYVADQQAAEIQVFDSRGEYLRTLGRRGRGPGEFGDLYSLAWLGDTLVVLDPRNARLGLMSASGEWFGLWRWQPFSGPAVRLHQATLEAVYAPVVVQPAAGTISPALVRFTHEGPGDTLAIPPVREDRPSNAVCSTPGGDIWFFSIPFLPGSEHSAGPDGALAVAWEDEYRILFLGVAGDTLRVVERKLDRVLLSDAEWGAATADFRAFREEHPEVSCQPAELPRPELKPALREMFFGVAGRLWVEIYMAEGFAFEVFDGEGHLIARLDGLERDNGVPPYARGDRLLLVTEESSGIQQVRALQVHDEVER